MANFISFQKEQKVPHNHPFVYTDASRQAEITDENKKVFYFHFIISLFHVIA